MPKTLPLHLEPVRYPVGFAPRRCAWVTDRDLTALPAAAPLPTNRGLIAVFAHAPFALALTLSAAVAACGKSGSESSGGGSGATTADGAPTTSDGSANDTGTATSTMTFKDAAEVCAAFADAHCSSEANCDAWSSKADCLAAPETIRRSEECVATTTLLLAQVQKGKVVFDQGKLGSCLAALALTCSGSVGLADCAALPFTGTRKLGDGCQSDHECTPNGYCAAGTAACGAVCQKFAPIGQACGDADTDAKCGPTAGCQVGKCAARSPKGEACVTGSGCQANATCVNGTCKGFGELPTYCKGGAGDGCIPKSYSCISGASGTSKCTVTLTRLLSAGKACFGITDSVQGGVNITTTCQKGLHCAVDSQMCVANLTVGAACDPTKAQCASASCGGDKSCAALPGEGAACSKFCAPGLRCIQSKCGKRLAAGGACNYPTDCQSTQCEANSCAAPCEIP